MAPEWVRRIIENHLTPLMCGLAVAGYTWIEAHYPFAADLLASAGVPKAFVVPAIVGIMGFVANIIDRHWSKPVLQPAKDPPAA